MVTPLLTTINKTNKKDQTMDTLVSQLSVQDISCHNTMLVKPVSHRAGIYYTHSNMSDRACHLQYRCKRTKVRGVCKWASIQIWRKRSETQSRLWCRWTKRHSLVPRHIWFEQTITDSSHTAENKTTQLEYQQCSQRKTKKTTKKQQQFKKKTSQ